MKQVIYIFGASGSGTTTLGKAIGEKFGFYHMDTDDYFWQPTDPPYQTPRPIPERLQLMNRDIDGHEKVVISGAIGKWGDELKSRYTLAVRLECDTDTRITRLKEREYRNHGERILPGGDMYEHHLEFIQWAKQFDIADENIRSRARLDAWEKTVACPMITMDGSADLDEKLSELKNWIK